MTLYFAYGSNLHPARLCARAPSALLVGTGYCPGRRLLFQKIGRDGSAKCDAPLTGCDPGNIGDRREAGDQGDPSGAGGAQNGRSLRDAAGARVHGALYRIGDRDLQALDRLEGLGSGYDRITVEVAVGQGTLAAIVYVAQPDWIDSELRPFHWYKRLVLAGARYLHLPEDHVAEIAAVPSVADPDPERAAANLACLDADAGSG